MSETDLENLQYLLELLEDKPEESIQTQQKSIKFIISKIKEGLNEINHPDLSWIFEEFWMKTEFREFFKKYALRNPGFLYQIKINCNKMYMNSCYETIHYNTNQINQITGLPGTGKSKIGLKLMQIIKKIWLKDLNYKIHISYVFNPMRLGEAIGKMKHRDFIQSDEWGNLTGTNSRALLKKMKNIVASMRSTQKCINICTPMNVSLGEGITSIFIPFGFKRDYVILKHIQKFITLKKNNTEIQRMILNIHNIRVSHQEIRNIRQNKIDYPKYKPISRVLWYSVPISDKISKKMELNGILILDLSSIKYLEKEYEEQKRLNHKLLEENQGGIPGQSDQMFIEIRENAKKLFQFGFENYNYPKNPDKPEKEKIYDFIFETGIGLEYTGKQEKVLLNQVILLAKRYGYTGLPDNDEFEKQHQQHQEQKKGQNEKNHQKISPGEKEIEAYPIPDQAMVQLPEKSRVFRFDKSELLAQIMKASKSECIERNIRIYKELTENLRTPKELMKDPEYEGLTTTQAFYNIKSSIQGALNEKIGKLYEQFYYPILKAKYKEVIYDGRKGKPDFEITRHDEIKIYLNVKCLEFNKEAEILYKKIKSEIMFGRDYYQKTGKIPIVRLIVYNRFNHQLYTRDLTEAFLTSKNPITKQHKIKLKLDHFDQIPV